MMKRVEFFYIKLIKHFGCFSISIAPNSIHICPFPSLITTENWTKYKEQLLEESGKWILVGWLWKEVKTLRSDCTGMSFSFLLFSLIVIPQEKTLIFECCGNNHTASAENSKKYPMSLVRGWRKMRLPGLEREGRTQRGELGRYMPGFPVWTYSSQVSLWPVGDFNTHVLQMIEQ